MYFCHPVASLATGKHLFLFTKFKHILLPTICLILLRVLNSIYYKLVHVLIFLQFLVEYTYFLILGILFTDSILGLSSTTYCSVLQKSAMVEVFAANQGDCNSNNLEVLDATLSSYRSNASSQDNADFFQDYSDYQWFADYR